MTRQSVTSERGPEHRCDIVAHAGNVKKVRLIEEKPLEGCRVVSDSLTGLSGLQEFSLRADPLMVNTIGLTDLSQFDRVGRLIHIFPGEVNAVMIMTNILHFRVLETIH